MAKKKTPLMRRILGLLKDQKKKIGFLLLLIVAVQITDIVTPFVSKRLIDTLTAFIKTRGAMPWVTLFYCAVGILLATILSSVFKSTYNYILFKLSTSTEDLASNMASEKYLRLHVLFHHNSSSGQIIGRLERGAQAIYNILNEILGHNLIPPLATFLVVFAALLYQNVWIALVILIPFPIYLLATRKYSQRIYEIEQKSNDAFEAVSKEAYDTASNVLTVKKFSQEARETENKRKLLHAAREIQYEAEWVWRTMDNIQATIATATRVVVLCLSAWFVLRGSATIGDFVLYISLQSMAYHPLAELSQILPRLRRNATRAERLFELIDEPLLVTDKPDAVTLLPLAHDIVLEDVSFAYKGDENWALKDISLRIPAGKTYALVGRSGSGKTTFINLLLRSFDPTQGRLLVDGIDIRDATQESLRNQIAVVPQEVDLFSRTVAENIAYGRPEVTHEQIEAAARTALAHDFILKLEDGYNTVVGERGIKLSGGERQRIGIARAVLRDPRILILDEATSHLDTESERFISKATDALIKNRTSLIIAHRLSTVLHADKIIVFNENTIEAVGSHAELLQTSPTYKKLHALQFAEE